MNVYFPENFNVKKLWLKTVVSAAENILIEIDRIFTVYWLLVLRFRFLIRFFVHIFLLFCCNIWVRNIPWRQKREETEAEIWPRLSYMQNKQFAKYIKLFFLPKNIVTISWTRDRGSTRSASARRREGDRFESRSNTVS